MYQIFKSHNRFIKGILEAGQVDYIKSTYRAKLHKLLEYYHEGTFYLRNDHILVRLLNSGLGSLHTNYDVFVETAIYAADTISKGFQFTNASSYGKIWYGDFYGEDSYEIIIGDNTKFDLDLIIKNWKYASPVRLLTHPVSDFGLSLPNGKKNHTGSGLSVIYINLPMLFLMYRLFIEDQTELRRSKLSEGIISPKLFLYRYILPGMMSSHLDHVMMNRIINLKDKMPMTSSLVRSPFFQAEAGDSEHSGLINMVNKSQELTLFKLTNSQVDYEQALANILEITHKDGLELLRMPNIAPTRQVWWALLLSRLKHIKFLLQISKENKADQNKMYHNRAVIDFSRLLDSHVLEKMFSANLLESLIDEVSVVIELAKH